MTAAITTPHPAATSIGMGVLHKGGTASEALIAAGAALAVITPHFCGLGGDAVWLVVDKDGGQYSFLAIGQGLDRPTPEVSIPLRGPDSILTSAAVVDGWNTAFKHSRATLGGQTHWADLLSPAIALAQDGSPVTQSQAFWGEFRAPEFQNWSGFEAIFTQEGRPLQEGHLLRQPALAQTLCQIAEKGSDEFYRGLLAERIVDGLRAEGVRIDKSDLARTSSRVQKPVTLDYRGLTLLAPPAPTQGITTLQIMGILSRFDLSNFEPGSADHFHHCVEAVKQAFLQRNSIADPKFSRICVEDFLAARTLDRLAANISTSNSLPWPHKWRHGDTVFLGAIDEQGNAASVLQSIYFDWGSGVVAGDTGIIWQNRGAAFSHDITDPNAFAPGKLPFYTLTPGVALKEGRPHLVYGTQGADGQPQTLAMILTRLIDFAQDPVDALAAPRFLLGRTFSDSRDSLKIETSAGNQTVAELKKRGHEVKLIPTHSPIAGQAGIVRSSSGQCMSWHDPRS